MATSVIQQVRSLIQDKTPPDGILSDEDIQAFLDIEGGDIYAAASMAAQSLSAAFSQKVDIKAGPIEIKNSQKAKAYASLSKALARSSISSGDTMGVILTGTSISAIDAADGEADRFSSVFYRGVTDFDDSAVDEERR